MQIKVLKFGGTSVEDASAFRNVVDIIQDKTDSKKLVVVSACAGITNKLIKIAESAYSEKLNDALNLLKEIELKHKNIIFELLDEKIAIDVFNNISKILRQIENMIHGVCLLGELSLRSLDKFMSFGELISSRILASALLEKGANVKLLDVREIMITDSDFGNAKPNFALIKTQIEKVLIPDFEKYEIIVTQGFIGKNEQGITTTLGRGGSDYTASILGSAINAEVIEIWTDVDGMMTADPRIVPDAKLIPEISFIEASELAYFGAKVLHPNTILPAIQKNIPVYILNSRNPKSSGTKIISSPTYNNNKPIKSIAFKKGITIISIYSSRMLLAYGFLAKLFSIFANFKKSVDVISTSEVSVSLTIDNLENIDKIEKELSEIGDIQIEYNKSIICIVGEGIKKNSIVLAKIFNTLAQNNITIDMISEGASEINITLVIDENLTEKTIKILHYELFNN